MFSKLSRALARPFAHPRRLFALKIGLVGTGAGLIVIAGSVLVFGAGEEPRPSRAAVDLEGPAEPPASQQEAVANPIPTKAKPKATPTAGAPKDAEDASPRPTSAKEDQRRVWVDAARPTATPTPRRPAAPPASQPSGPPQASAPVNPAPAQPTSPPPPLPPTNTPVPPPPPPPPPPPAPSCPTASMSGFALDLFNAINAERVAAGMAPFAANGCVTYVAQQRSNDMAANNYFAHESPSGESAFSLLDAYRVPHGWAGENLARNNYPNDQTVAVAVRDLMASPGHRDNILSGNYNQLGVGLATSGNMKYFTMVFIGPPV